MESNIVILKGYGFFYGHVIKAKLLKIIENENLAIIHFNQKEIAFDLVNGFEGKKIQYSGYQLDITSINIDPLIDLTDNTTYEFGKV